MNCKSSFSVKKITYKSNIWGKRVIFDPNFFSIKMKKSVLLTLALGVSTLSFAQAHLSGKIDGLTNDKLVVSVINEQNTDYERIDTVAAPGGQFSYTFPGLTGYRTAILFALPKDENDKPARFYTFVCKGQSGVVSGNMADKTVTVKGSSLYEASNKADEIQKPFDEKLAAIADEYDAAEESKKDAIEARYNAELNEVNKKLVEYIKANPSDEVSFFLANNCKDRLEAYGLLSKSLREGEMKGYIAAMEANIKAAAEREAKRNEAMKNLQPGMPAPEITLNDLDGKPLSLSQLQGKYVIIDWWGSWCIWCIRGIPKMKEYYEKYNSKMEILGVDCNDTDAKWRAAVKEYELPWKHVYMPRGSKLTETWAIQGYPTKCIINPDGTINKIIVGEDPKFYDYLDELLKD